MQAKLISQNWLITDKKGEFKCPVKIDENHIEIGKEFVFKSKNSPNTIKRWKKVLKMLSYTVRFLESKTQ